MLTITTPEQMREAAAKIAETHQVYQADVCAARIRAIPLAPQPAAVTVKSLVWTGGAILVATGPDIQTIGHSIPSDIQVEYDAERAARILSALTIHPADPLSDPRVVALVEAATKIASLQKSTLTDVGSAHSNRGAGASGWMREDDRDFMQDLDNAFTSVTSALRAIGGEA